MFCPECGQDAGDAKFCPECGTDLENVRSSLKGGATRPVHGRSHEGQRRGLAPAVIWGLFGAIAVIAVVLVVVLSGGFGGKPGTTSSSGSASATPVLGVTTGSYADLVQKANDLYNQGQGQLDTKNYDQGVVYFQAAAMTYAAAWQKQSTDPGVGTDFASSLFYSGALDAAIKQADVVLAKHPSFQPAYLTKGNALVHKSLVAAQDGDAKAGKTAEALAKKAYAKAVALDPASQAGKLADQALQSLTK
jgi:hypothetical protein